MKQTGLFLIFLFISISSFSQYFSQIDSIPVVENSLLLRNAWAGGINYPNVSQIDLNGDGLKDLFLFDRLNSRITTYLNNGSTNADLAWDFAPQYATQFPYIANWVYLYDYNGDGREDVFSVSPLGTTVMAVYRNDYSAATGLQWTMVTDYLDEEYSTIRQNIYVNGVSLPSFGDVDGDGDMDILGYVNSVPGRIAFHKNYSMENYGVSDSLDFKYETSCWGNFSLQIGGANEVGCFHCPCRTSGPQQPEADVKDFPEISGDQSLAAQPDDTVSSILVLDIEGDGDMDLLVGDVASYNSLLIVNEGDANSAEMGSQDVSFPSYNLPADFNGFHYHAFLDLDNDGLKDLLIIANEFENGHGLWFYKNVGTSISPLFEFREDDFLQNQMIEAGETATPVVIDFDADGLQDIVMGYNAFVNSSGTARLSLRYYKNIGTFMSPEFELINEDVGAISQFNYLTMIYPAFGDLDGDGDLDLLLGRSEGILDYYVNTAGSGNVPVFTFNTYKYMRIDVGNFIAPQLFDVDKDGLLDIVAGEQAGNLNYFRNRGSSAGALYDSIPTSALFGCIVLHNASTPEGYTSPFLYDSLGTTLLAVACSDGLVYRYDSLDGNTTGCFRFQALMNTHAESSRYKFNISITGGDINQDGKTDFVLGQSTGGLQFHLQTSSAIGIPEIQPALPSMEVFPNPSGSNINIRFFNMPDNGAILRLFDMTGSLIEEKNIIDACVNLNVRKFVSGVYIVQLVTGVKVISARVQVVN